MLRSCACISMCAVYILPFPQPLLRFPRFFCLHTVLYVIVRFRAFESRIGCWYGLPTTVMYMPRRAHGLCLCANSFLRSPNH